ncbi:MAG: mitochondrial carrier domain-containing protein [Linnemannia gamsii]|nr:MAG: mitochondrial carrier domain-containing protein [Linnemannia gamsii]
MTPTVSIPPPPHSSSLSPSTIPTGIIHILKTTTSTSFDQHRPSQSHKQQPQQFTTQPPQGQQQQRPIVSSPWTIQAYSVSEKGDKDTVRGSATVGVPTAVARSMLLQALQFWYRVPIKLFRPMRVDYLVMARAATMGIIPTPANRAAFAESQKQLSKRTQFFRATSVGMVAHAIKTQGAGFIYRQVLPPLIMNSFIGSVLYTTYIFTLPVFHPAFTYQKSRTFPPPPFPAVFMAGALAGAAQSLVAAPMDSLKVKFQVQDLAHGGKHKSMSSFAVTTLKEMGLKTVYRGFALTLVKDSLACGLFFGVFEWVKQQGYYYFIDELYGIREDMELLKARALNELSSSSSTTTEQGPPPLTAPSDVASRPYFLMEPTFVLLAGAAAAVAYQAVDYPLEQVKTIFYAKETALVAETLKNTPPAHTQHLNSSSMRSGTSISQQLYALTWQECKSQASSTGGWRRFLYANFASTAIRAVPAASVGFLVFELMKRKLDARRYEIEDREMVRYLDLMMAERDAERRAEWIAEREYEASTRMVRDRDYREVVIS